MADASSLGDALSKVERKLYQSVSGDGLRRIQRAGGAAAKDAALETAAGALGGDRAMSGFKRGRVKLGAGYDVKGTLVDLNLRPAGAWVLADQGRRGVAGPLKPIRPKKRGGKKALATPWGPRASVRGSRSRGLRVVDHTVDRAEREVPKAAFNALQRELRSQFRG